MTIYVHNPPDPNATPTQPVIDVTLGTGFAIDQTEGRCGFCASVPKIWLVLMQPEPGDPVANAYAGFHYMRKVRYRDRLGDFCEWVSSPGELLPNAHTYGGFRLRWAPGVADQDLSGFGWILYAPLLDDDDKPIEGTLSTSWLFQGDQFNGWRCLRPNVMRRKDADGWSNAPITLTVSPFWP